jgi:enhancing lycopene biosynthesis protein 2
MKIGVILSGCGVYDGSEIQEAVFTLLSIAENGGESICFAPDKEQAQVIDHTTGAELPEKRNVLKEAARIARGNIRDIRTLDTHELNGLVIPGGFGAAKNLNRWAFEGPDGAIDAEVARVILEMVQAGKPIAALCMGPTVIAKALEGSGKHPSLTVGTTAKASPYDIAGISAGMEKIGTQAVFKSVQEIQIDLANKIISAPCYMMEASIMEVRENIQLAINELFTLINNS